MVVWEGPLWPPELSADALVVLGGAVAWSIGTVVAARGIRGRGAPLALAGWQMTAGGAVLVLVRRGGGGGPVDHRRARGRPRRRPGGRRIGGAARALLPGPRPGRPPREVSAWFFLVPVVGVLTAWPLLDETPSVRLVVGMAGVSAGLWLVLGPRAAARGRLVDSPTPP